VQPTGTPPAKPAKGDEMIFLIAAFIFILVIALLVGVEA
jgi:hypothetical protein